jgi:hypothetical protein
MEGGFNVKSRTLMTPACSKIKCESGVSAHLLGLPRP